MNSGKCRTCQKFKLDCHYRKPQPTKYVACHVGCTCLVLLLTRSGKTRCLAKSLTGLRC